MNLSSIYYSRYAVAYIRGLEIQERINLLPPILVEKPLDELTEEETEKILMAGKNADLKLYRFKNTHDGLPRVKRTLGFLKSIEMDSLLDVGSGRGAFLWPCLNLFPYLNVLSVDLLSHRVDMLSTVRQGGIFNLNALEANICKLSVPDKSYDVVTMLEVLEHIPDTAAAVQSAVRIAKKFIVITVPSKPDSNPEHIHLLTKEVLSELFNKAGCSKLHFDGVSGHLLMVAAMDSKQVHGGTL